MPARRARRQEDAILLSDLSLTNPKKYTHYKTDAFTITSDVPIADIATCDVLEKHFFGALGCYFYPSDSTLVLHGCSDGIAALELMKKDWVCQCKEEIINDRTYHISVATTLNVPPEEEDEEEDEDDDEDYASSNEEEDGEEGDEDADAKEEWMSDDELPPTDAR